MTLRKAMGRKEFNRASGFLQARAHNDVKVEGVCSDHAKDQYQDTICSDAERRKWRQP